MVGLAIARAAALIGHEVIVAEATLGIGNGVSSRNSEVIHAGMYYPHDSIRAIHCVRGRQQLYEYCESRNIPHRKCGKLIVATEVTEVASIEGILRQSIENGVEGCKLIERDGARILEPSLCCHLALFSPETGIVDSHQLMLSLLGDVENNGGVVAFDTKIDRIRRSGQSWTVDYSGSSTGELTVDAVINCAGLGAIDLASKTEAYPTERLPKLHFCRGNYFSFSGKPAFSRLIYPAPRLDGGLGTHVTLDLAGRMKFGPDVEWIDGEDYRVNPHRSAEFYASIRRYWPELPDNSLQPDYAGIRPKLSGPGERSVDFVLEGPTDHGEERMVHLFGIESPGLTSALSLADEVVRKLS